VTRGYQPDFDIDLVYGEEGEMLVRHVLELDESRIEVKRKSYIDDEFYVEIRHDPGRRGAWRASGLAKTKADYYVYVVADTGVLIFVPTALLRERLADALG
jgi:hypothetical protein